MRILSWTISWTILCFLWLGSMPLAAEMSFEDFVKQRRGEFQQFREARDQEFHGFLQQRWEEFQVFRGEREDPTPKPKAIPKPPAIEPAKPARIVPVTPPEPPARPTPVIQPRRPPALPPTPPAKPSGPRVETIGVDLLGHHLTFEVEPRWRQLRLQQVNNEGIAAFWVDFASLPSDSLIGQLQRYRERLALNDWGYLWLTRQVGAHLVRDGNLAELLAWGLLLKSGFDVRVGYYDRRVVLLFKPEQALYEVPFFTLGGKRYFLGTPHDGSNIRLHTYAADYPGAATALDMLLPQVPRAAASTAQRTLSFDFKGRNHRIVVPSNRPLIEFLATVPQLELKYYFLTAPHEEVAKALTEQLKTATYRMDRHDSVEFLLRFVQTALSYQTDDEQFGVENYLQIEETLYYPAADCEDRSILFVWLIEHVLGLRAVALDYPGHVAAAVDLGHAGEGLYVDLDGRRFTVADATYINAGIGRVVPPYEQKQPQVIRVD